MLGRLGLVLTPRDCRVRVRPARKFDFTRLECDFHVHGNVGAPGKRTKDPQAMAIFVGRGRPMSAE